MYHKDHNLGLSLAKSAALNRAEEQREEPIVFARFPIIPNFCTQVRPGENCNLLKKTVQICSKVPPTYKKKSTKFAIACSGKVLETWDHYLHAWAIKPEI